MQLTIYTERGTFTSKKAEATAAEMAQIKDLIQQCAEDGRGQAVQQARHRLAQQVGPAAGQPGEGLTGVHRARDRTGRRGGVRSDGHGGERAEREGV